MSQRRERLSWLLIGLLLVAVALTAYYIVWPRLQPHTTLRVGDGVFTARVYMPGTIQQADMATQPQLRNDKAIVYVYDQDGLWTIDVQERDAQFDILWLDAQKKIVHIVKNASFESLPGTTFRPSAKARYMIELRGGTVDDRAIKIDSTAYFDEDNLQGLKL